MPSIAEKYNVGPFDPSDPRDARSEKARQVLIKAFLGCEDMIYTGDDLQDVLSGLMLGVVSIMGAQIASTDESHAALRASLLEMIPYSVDLFRSMSDLPPLPEV
jgi:hypothetical protein